MRLTLLAQTEIDTGDLAEAFDGGGLTAADWLSAAAVLVGAILVAVVLRQVVRRVVERRDATPFAARFLSRFLGYVVVVAGVVYALSALGVRIGPLLGALGIAGVALAFALQDVIENFVAGLILQVRRPFTPGEQVAIGEYEGTVEDVNARAVVVVTPDGERAFVPAGEVLANPIVNLTRLGRRRTTLDIGVAYDTDLEKAHEVLLEAAAATALVKASPEPEVRVSAFADSSINLSLRFWHDPSIASMWAARDRMAVAAKEALDDAGIEIAFPQVVIRQGPS